MPVTPNDFIRLAVTINIGSGEIEFRTAASKAYYGAYHACVALANRIGIKVPNVGHRSFCKLLQSFQGSNEVNQLGVKLEQCFDLRVLADYKITSQFINADSADCIINAQDILARSSVLP